MTTCKLVAAEAVITQALPPDWGIGVFGSAARCPGGPEPCEAAESDVDVVLVHPPGEESAASALRRQLVRECLVIGVVVDVVVLSIVEVETSYFWQDEKVLELRIASAKCV